MLEKVSFLSKQAVITKSCDEVERAGGLMLQNYLHAHTLLIPQPATANQHR